MNSNTCSSEKIVRAQHRAARAIPPLGFLAGGLAVLLALLWLAHPTFAPVDNWRNLGAGWLVGIVITLAGALAFARAYRRPLQRTAAELDAALATHNRLEAATTLQNAHDPMAQAQRTETEQFLKQTKLAPRNRWLPALVTLTATLALAHLVTLACWARSVNPELAANEESTTATEKKPAAPPSASLEWQSPETETTATAIEEVPLEAEADSSTGLRDVVLEVQVNGAPKLSQPLNDDLTKPGKHDLKLSIYLDQLEVKTYDIVSYHLRAQRIFSAKLPPTVSEVQFIQIKPMREDTFVCAGGDQPSKCFNYVSALKVAQLRLMKENFTLAHAEISKTSEEWREENSRVGGDQTELAARADEVIELMTTNNYPPQILGLVRQSQPLMTDAGGKIIKTQNQPALEPQGQALGYLTEVEKYLKHSISLAGQSKQPKANDPFHKAKNLDLKKKPLTRAGKVDVLAKEQSRLAGDLASGNTNSMLKLPSEDAKPDREEIAGTPGERQQEIKKRIEDMLNDPGFEKDALKHLQASDELAGKSQQQIGNQDFAAASEPAAEAARELRQTAAALRADGEQSAKNKLADALLQLGAAAGNVRKAAKAKSDAEASAELQKSEDAVRDAAKRLEEEARQQQANGATNSAARLEALAKLLQGEGLKQLQAQAQQEPRNAGRNEALAQRLEELAERAAELRNQGQPTRQELARLVERMQRTQANLKNLASQCSSPGAAQSGKSSGQAASSGGNPGQLSQTVLRPTATGGTRPTASASESGVTRARGHEPSREELQQMLAENLLQELHEQTLDAMAAKPGASELKKLREILNRKSNGGLDTGEMVAFAAAIDPPLTGLITLLRQELTHYRRQHQLTNAQVAQAPRAYRPAVAEYFEQLSRDYATDAGGAK